MFKKIIWSFLVTSGLVFAASWINSAVNGCRRDYKSDQALVYKIAQYRS